jgi:uncharacterized protein (TIGR03437 family)
MNSARFLTFAFLSAVLEPAVWAQSVIVTAAGTDLVFRGNGARAPGVSLGRISRVVVDPSGRPVFADPNYHLVFRAEPDGSIRVIAGNNVQGLNSTSQLTFNQSGGGYSGDLGQATAAALNRPVGVAYDTSGNLYIGDTLNHRIRMVNSQGVISTIAGNGQASYQGEGSALGVALNFPTDVVVDKNGNVYVNDTQNFRIRRITPQGVISTVAGNGTQGTSGENVPAASSPIGSVEGMALDSQGNLYLAEFSTNRVRRLSGGVLTTVAGNGNSCYNGDGPALGVCVDHPGGVAVDSSGNLLITDTENQRIRKLAGGNLTTIAGNGQAGFSGDFGAPKSATLHNPFGVAGAATGEIYIADRDNFRIRHIDAQQSAISTLAGDGRLIAAQNGIAAGLATFLDPFGVSFDAQGRQLLVADTDNNIIRRGNPDGTLAIIAGTGAAESGDAGLATQVGLDGPFSVTADASGNLLESEINAGSVRRIAPNGTISTIASGLNAPAQAVVHPTTGDIYIADFYNNRIMRRVADGTMSAYLTSVANPGGLAFDPAANLYFTEWGGGRLWRVSPSGTLTLIAGGGNIAGSAADGGPATSAKLGRPAGVTLDTAGNVYFTDASNSNVRKVSPSGTISTVAGNGRAGLAGDGGPATGASLNGPWGLAFDAAGALYVADTLNNRIRKILSPSNAPSFTVDNSTLSLAAASNGTITDPAAVNVSSSLTGLLYSASADQPWLQVSLASSAMPSRLQVTADPTGLAPGTYSGKVTVSAPGANPNSRPVTVTFTVGPAQPAGIGVDTKTLSFAFTAGADSVTRQVTVRNLGSGPLNYSASTCGSPWLAVTPASGSTTPNSPASVTVTATPGSLAPGTYTCALTVSGTSAATPLVIPVSASITAPSTKLLLTQSGLTFQAVPGGGAPLPRTFGILNTGQGPMTWSAVATTYSGGSWLSISPINGAVTTPFTDVSQVSVGVDPSKLTGGAGTYYGKVDVNVPGLRVQSVTVVLNVSSAVTSDVYPSGLVFTGVPGSNPGSQTFSVANLSSQSLSFTSSRLTQGGPSWFVHVPTSGTIAPNQPLNIVVQPDFTNLTPGTYQGAISLQFSDGSTANISLLAVTSSAGATPAITSGMTGKLVPLDATAGCSPTSLNITLSGSQQTLSVSIGQPVAIEVLLTDTCGSVTGNNKSAAVSVAFSNFDSNIDLLPIPNQPGKWQQSWTPKNSVSGPITVHIRASETTPRTVLLQGKDVTANVASVAPAAAQPLIASVGIQNAASFAAGLPVAPGGLVTIKGSRLADGTDTHLDPPLLTSLCGTQLLLGGTPLPMIYCSDTQINAQIPPGLPLNTQHQISVVRGNAPPVPSVPDLVAVAAASPAIFTVSQTGQGQGTIVYNGTATLADPSAPAKAGDLLAIYCTGLGEVDQPVGAGQPAPFDPLAHTVNPVSVTIGGVPVAAQDVLFAGLTPGFAGLYQVNLRMPSGVTPGNQVPVLLTQAGQQSPPVTMAVR